jgi:hypothetical protein
MPVAGLAVVLIVGLAVLTVEVSPESLHTVLTATLLVSPE